ncbi:MAG TPA: hypothetical protein VIJ21_00615, partial [Solirubrobacterales bacterium]
MPTKSEDATEGRTPVCPPIDPNLIEQDAAAQVERLRKQGLEVRDDFYSAAITAYGKDGKNRDWRDKQSIDAYELGKQIAEQLEGLVAKAAGKPVEEVVYVCQHCGNACWYDDYNSEWKHRSPGPVQAHEP